MGDPFDALFIFSFDRGGIHRKWRVNHPTRLFVGGFVAAALAGGVLLSLPFSASNARINFIDALFTATSAV
jgi:hypothetical protein